MSLCKDMTIYMCYLFICLYFIISVFLEGDKYKITFLLRYMYIGALSVSDIIPHIQWEHEFMRSNEPSFQCVGVSLINCALFGPYIKYACSKHMHATNSIYHKCTGFNIFHNVHNTIKLSSVNFNFILIVFFTDNIPHTLSKTKVWELSLGLYFFHNHRIQIDTSKSIYSM